jgi:hypothetical protein
MKLHLAGADSARKLVAAVAGSLAADSKATPYLLTSYWYSRLQAGDKANGLWRTLYDFVDAEWVVDSGLFTMMFGSGRGRTYDIKELRAYTAKYVRYLNEIQYRHYAVEMDVHKVLGMNAVFELRAYLEDHWPVEQTIYVWHEEEGVDGLKKLAAERPYIALSIPELREVASKRKLDLNMLVLNLLNSINEAGRPKVHLLGCSQPSVMFNPHYTSTDSTSWTAPARWKKVQVFDGKTFRAFDKHWGTFQKNIKRHEGFIRTYYELVRKQLGVDTTFNERDIAVATLACWYKRMELTINKEYYGGTP